MKFFCRPIFFWICLALPFSPDIYAQTESTAFTATGRGGVATTFATDYQSIGINPANLGIQKSFRDPKLTLGFLEVNTTFFAEALTRKETINTIFNSGEIQFTAEEKRGAAEKIANTSFSLNADIMLMGASLKLPKNQGIALSIRDRIQLFSRINESTAELAFMGASANYFPELLLSNGDVIPNPRYQGNGSLEPLTQEEEEQVILGLFSNQDSAKFYSEIMNGSRIASTWFREINLSYGKQLVDTYNFSLFFGAGLRYIMGITMIEMEAQNNALTASNISLSEDFGLSFGSEDDVVSSPTFRPPNDVGAFRRFAYPRPVGRGIGIDLGLTMIIKKNLYVGMSVTNIGNINWDGNVYKVNDGKLVQFAGSGFNNFNILASDQGAFQFAGDKSPLSWEGSNSIRQELPSTIRFGASYEYHRTWHIGFDIIAPRNRVPGNLEGILYAIGGDFRPNRVFKISSGVNFGGNNQSKVNIPLGITYIARKGFYETGIATRDITTYLADFGGGSTISFAAGFLRFKL